VILQRTLGDVTVGFDTRGPPTQDEAVICEVWDDVTYRWGFGDVAGCTVLDVGANVGGFTLWAAAAGAAHVRAIEPEPDNYRALLANVMINGDLAPRIDVHQIAAAPRSGSVSVHSRPSGAGTFTTARPGSDGIPVLASSLGGLLVGLGDDVVVKCDIEGAEYDLFAAASDDDLRRIARLAMEWHNPADPEGLGENTGAGPHRFGELVSVLARHHHVSTSGMPDRGGLLWATRY
jgi:FkbM family methyltransferase